MPPDSGKGAPDGLNLIRKLRPGEIAADMQVPPSMLHPASGLQMYTCLLGGLIWHPSLRFPTSARFDEVSLERRRKRLGTPYVASHLCAPPDKLAADVRSHPGSFGAHHTAEEVDLLVEAERGATAEERMYGVLRWVLAAIREPPYFKKPVRELPSASSFDIWREPAHPTPAPLRAAESCLTFIAV